MKRLLSGKKYLFLLALYLSDVFMLLLSAVITLLLFRHDIYDVFFARCFLFFFLILIINYSSYGLYRDKRNLFDDKDFMRIVYSIFVSWFIILVFNLLFLGNKSLLLIVSVTSILTLITTSFGRVFLYKIIFVFRKIGYDRRRVVFFGKRDNELINKILENKSLGYDIIKITNDFEVLKKYLRTAQVVFLKMDSINDKFLELIMKNDRINWKIIPPVLNLVIDPVEFDEFKDYPIINVSKTNINSNYAVLKRLMDFVASGIALVLLSPFFLFVAIVIKSTMPGPVFFKHERLGKDLKPFQLYKFRTMVVDADKMKSELMRKNEVNGLFKMKNDPRITKFGKILRRTYLDELPQLINVFKGNMSLVGPRPHLKIELGNFKGWRMVRFKVKPGLTGLWQISGRHELNFDKAVLYDIYYIKHMSLRQDLSIIFRTLPSIVITKGKF